MSLADTLPEVLNNVLDKLKHNTPLSLEDKDEVLTTCLILYYQVAKQDTILRSVGYELYVPFFYLGLYVKYEDPTYIPDSLQPLFDILFVYTIAITSRNHVNYKYKDYLPAFLKKPFSSRLNLDAYLKKFPGMDPKAVTFYKLFDGNIEAITNKILPTFDLQVAKQELDKVYYSRLNNK